MSNNYQPWAIARLGVCAKSRIIHRYHNRQDADDALRFLQRAVSRQDPDCKTMFVVCFVPPEETEP